MNDIRIGGLLKTTLLDYPGRMASTVFLPLCNMRCPFCHNRDMVEGDCESIRQEEVLAHLGKRSKILDGVCITGGEPTLYGESLVEFIRAIKLESGLDVKLDTNGTNPRVLETLIREELVEYVAMDIKSALREDAYAKACGRRIDLEPIRESISLLNASTIDHEFRTTVVKGIHEKDDIISAAESLQGSPAYFLQHFVNSGGLIAPEGLSDFSRPEMEEMAEGASRFVKTEIRGI